MEHVSSAPPPERWVIPTRGSLAWLSSALTVLGHAATGVVELPSQRELARVTGRSPGTVHEHVRRLGPEVVVSRCPLRVDLDAVARTGVCQRAPIGARRPTPPAADPSETGSRSTTGGYRPLRWEHDVLRTARQLIETALALLSLVNSDPAAAGDRAVFARGSRVPRGSRRAVLAARHSTRRDRSARAIQDQKDREILLSIFPDTARDRVPRAAMADAARSSRSATSGDVAAMLATVDEVREAVRPLVEYCQRCAPPLPAHLDTAGIEVLRRIAPEQLRATAVRVKALAIAGVAHRPLGLLVAKARTDPQFFDHADTTPVPPPHSGPAVGIEAGSTDDEQPDTDPDVAVDPDLPLAADQAAAIEAELDRRYGPSPTASPARAGLRALFTARATARTSP